MENNKLDLISDLPFEILTHIISFLPLKEAVRSTSSLSTLWRQLLAPQTVHLEFETSNFQQVLGKFLSSYISPERWKLLFLAGETEEDCSEKADVGVAVMATKGVEKELHLHFLKKSGKKKTTSHGFVLKLQQSVVSLESVQSRSSFSSLRTLHLRSVNRQVVSLVCELFACCRHLENLKLEKCEGLEDLNVEGCDSLQSLEILDCEDFVSITVCAPNLESFSYRGALPRMRLEGTSDLVDADLDLRHGVGGNEFDCEDVLCLLASLKEVQILTISGWLLEVMTLLLFYVFTYFISL